MYAQQNTPVAASSLLGTGSVEFLSSSRRAGEMVRKSTPASALISPTCAFHPVSGVYRHEDKCTYIAETRSHHDRVVSVLFVVIKDLLYRLNTGIVVTLIIFSGILLVPVKNLQNEILFQNILARRGTL